MIPKTFSFASMFNFPLFYNSYSLPLYTYDKTYFKIMRLVLLERVIRIGRRKSRSFPDFFLLGAIFYIIREPF